MKNKIEGMLLCSECENQLRVDVYSEEFGFFKVYPCVHCPVQQADRLDAKELAQAS